MPRVNAPKHCVMLASLNFLLSYCRSASKIAAADCLLKARQQTKQGVAAAAAAATNMACQPKELVQTSFISAFGSRPKACPGIHAVDA